MTTANEADLALIRDLHAEMTKPETIQRLFHVVLPHLRKGEKSLVYILAQVDRIGHAVIEPWSLLALFADDYDRILVVTGPGDGPGYNPDAIDCAGPKIVRVVTDDPVLPFLGALDAGIQDLQLFDLCIYSPQHLFRDGAHKMLSMAEWPQFVLTDKIRATGEAFFQAVGKPADAPWVVLHIRDMTYMPEKAHHSFRCADYRNYTKAIQEVVDAGYWVFRLGDAASPPLKDMPPEVVDLPHHLRYSKALDSFLSAGCAFAINQASGPEALMRAFGRPAMAVNLIYDILRLPSRDDFILFKDYVDDETGKSLSYERILELDLPAFGDAEAFERLGVRIEENTPEELAAMARLMIARDRGEEIAVDPERLERFWELSADYARRLAADPEKSASFLDIYPLSHRIGLPAPILLNRPGYVDESDPA